MHYSQLMSFLALAASSFLSSNAQSQNLGLYQQHIAALKRTCHARDDLASLVLESTLLAVTPVINSTSDVAGSHLEISSWAPEGACVEVDNIPEHYHPSEIGIREFCAYVDPHFAGGRGIAMVTSPEIAEYVNTKTPAFTDPKLFNGASPHSHPYPSFYEKQIPGRGVGLIANQTIHRGDLIFRYAPVLVMHVDALKSTDGFHRVVKKLPPKTYELFMGLHAEFIGDRVDSIIYTNGFQGRLGPDDELHYIVLPEIARMNHDCRPNAVYYFEETEMLHYVYATQTIQAGEELSISYTDPNAPRAKRQEIIKISWGFDCSCSTCSQSPFQTAQSDRRLAMIDSLEEKLNDWSPESEATPATAEALISIYEQERMYAYMAIPYRLASLAYSSVCDREGATKYSLLALEQQKLESGEGAVDIEMIRSLLDHPEEHWSWCKRARN